MAVSLPIEIFSSLTIFVSFALASATLASISDAKRRDCLPLEGYKHRIYSQLDDRIAQD